MRSVRLLVYFLLGFSFAFIVGMASAATTVNLSLPSNVARSGSSFVTAGSAAFNGASFNSAFTTQVAGKTVTVPAVWRLASNAPSFAISAIRATPTGLIGSAVAAYLLSKGLEYLNGQWNKVDATVPAVDVWSGQGAYYATPEEGCLSWGLSLSYLCDYGPDSYGRPRYYCSFPNPANTCYHQAGTVRVSSNCPAGTTPNGTACVGSAIPAVESDWTNAIGSPLPDQVASELSPLVPLPLQKPEVSPAPIDIPLTDPYVDPVTGKRFQDIARVTPQPSTPEKAIVETVKQEVNPDGSPVVDPATQQPVAPEKKEEDPCELHPERVGCSEWGDPDDSDLTMTDKTVSITPQSGWGPDNGTCPSPLTYTPHKGPQIQFKYDAVCDGASFFRPVILGMAWISAIFAFFGISRRTET